MFAAPNLILKVKFSGGPARNVVAAPFRHTGAAPSQLPSAAPGRSKFAAAPQLPAAAPPRRISAARGRGIRTFVRNICSS